MSFSEVIDTLSAINQAMLTAAEEGDWDSFLALATERINKVQDYYETLETALSADKETISGYIERIQDLNQDYEAISVLIKSRMEGISKALVALKNGKMVDSYYLNKEVSA